MMGLGRWHKALGVGKALVVHTRTSLDTPKAMEILGRSGRAYVIPTLARQRQGKLCVQVNHLVSMNKVWFNQGRMPTSPLDIHMYAHTCEHTTTCMYAHTYTNTNMHRGKMFTHWLFNSKFI